MLSSSPPEPAHAALSESVRLEISGGEMPAGAGKGAGQEYFCPFCNTLCKDQGAHLILQVNYPPNLDHLELWNLLQPQLLHLDPLQHGSVVCPQPGCSTFLPHLEARRRHLREEHEGQVLHWYTVVQCTVLCFITALYCTSPCCTALHYTVLHFTLLHCTALYCTVLHFTLLHWTYCRWRGSAACVETSSPASTASSCTGLH